MPASGVVQDISSFMINKHKDGDICPNSVAAKVDIITNDTSTAALHAASSKTQPCTLILLVSVQGLEATLL